jgi:hypothetical protein
MAEKYMKNNEDFGNPILLTIDVNDLNNINQAKKIFKNTIYLNSIKEGCDKFLIFRTRIEEIRTIRNKLLKETDYYLLPDITIEENKLKEMKEYRQQLREFMNKLMNDEITCNIFDDDFEQKYLKQKSQ